jgi:hypothetical protein
MHSPFADKETMMLDKIHPGAEGANIIAEHIYDVSSLKSDKSFDIFPKILVFHLAKSLSTQTDGSTSINFEVQSDSRDQSITIR